MPNLTKQTDITSLPMYTVTEFVAMKTKIRTAEKIEKKGAWGLEVSQPRKTLQRTFQS